MSEFWVGVFEDVASGIAMLFVVAYMSSVLYIIDSLLHLPPTHEEVCNMQFNKHVEFKEVCTQRRIMEDLP